jgi:hypothetical protein
MDKGSLEVDEAVESSLERRVKMWAVSGRGIRVGGRQMSLSGPKSIFPAR